MSNQIEAKRVSSAPILNLVKLNLSYLSNNLKSVLSISIFFVISIMMPLIFIPVTMFAGISTIIYLVIPSLIILGSIGYGMKVSTLYGNMISTGYKKREFYISSIITIFIFSVVSSFVYWPIIEILGLIGLLKASWIGGYGYSINLLNLRVCSYLAYIIMLNSVLSFSIYFLIHALVGNIRNYYTIIFSIFILGIIFGGTLNTYFSRPDSIVGRAFLDGYLAENVWSIKNDNINAYVYLMNSEWSDYVLSFTGRDLHGQIVGGNLFPTSLFIPTLFYPLFGLGQFATVAVGSNVYYGQWQQQYIAILPEVLDGLTTSEIIIEINNNNSLINEIVFVNIFNGDVIDINNIDYSPSLDLANLFYIKMDKVHWQWSMVVIQPYLIIIMSFLIGKALVELK